MSEKAAQAEAKLDQPVAPVDNVSNQSSQIWSTSLESWNKSDKQMSPWKDADVGKDGFASSNKLLGDINNKDQSTKDGNTLDMSVPIDGAQTKEGEPDKNKAQNGVEAVDGQPNKNKAQNGVEALDGAQTKDGQPKKNKAQNGVEALDGAQTKDGEPNKNKAQNGVEAVDGTQTKEEQPNKNKAQNGVEAVDGTQTKEGEPNKNKAQNGVEAVGGTQTKEGEPNKNKAQNGVEAVDGTQTKEEQPNKNKAQNGVEAVDGQPKKNAAQNGVEEQKKTPEEQKSPEEQKKSPEDQKKADDQRKVEEQKLLEGALFDKNLSSEQKLSAAQELLKRGVTNVSGVDESGKNASLRLESEPAGGREMVHVFSSKEGGSEKTALRGIANADGSWEQQRNSRGKQVSFEGKGAADLASMRQEGSVPEKPAEPREGEAPRKEGEAPRKEGEAPRKEGEAPRKEVEAPRKEGEAPRKEVEAPRKEGEAPRKEVEAPRKEGEAPRKEGEAPQKEGTEKKVEGNESPQADKMAELHKMFDEAGKQAKGKVGKLVTTDKGVYVKSNFDVDVDGSPRAKQIDPDGRPDTSMQYKNGRYVNAEEVPYMVLPKDQFKKHGLKIGDMGLVRDTKSGNIAAAVFADAGPRGKTGEGSINLGKEGLGLKNITPTNGIDENRFEYLAMPKTNQGTPKNQAELLQRIDDFKRQMGLIK